MERETKQYRDFEERFGRPGGGPFNVLDIKHDGGELYVVIGAGVPPARLRVHFKGVIDFDSYTSGGEDWYGLPQRLNSLDRKSTRLNSSHRHYLVCRLLLEQKRLIHYLDSL